MSWDVRCELCRRTEPSSVFPSFLSPAAALDAYLHALGSRNFINGRTGTAVWNPCDLGNRSNTYAITKSGDIHRVGGWGHLLGDEGSGYQIGLQTLKTVIKSHEGILPPTIMSDLIVAPILPAYYRSQILHLPARYNETGYRFLRPSAA